MGLWYDIEPFLSIIYILNIDEYRSKRTKFESDLDKLYVVGAHIFLSSNYVGGKENLYSHVLKFIYLQ